MIARSNRLNLASIRFNAAAAVAAAAAAAAASFALTATRCEQSTSWSWRPLPRHQQLAMRMQGAPGSGFERTTGSGCVARIGSSEDGREGTVI